MIHMISNLINRRPPLGEMQTVSTFLNSARQVSRVFRVVAPRAAPETRPLHFSFCTTRLSERCAVVLTFGSKKVARGLWMVKHLKILISSTASHCNVLYGIVCFALQHIVLHCIVSQCISCGEQRANHKRSSTTADPLTVTSDI